MQCEHRTVIYSWKKSSKNQKITWNYLLGFHLPITYGLSSGQFGPIKVLPATKRSLIKDLLLFTSIHNYTNYPYINVSWLESLFQQFSNHFSFYFIHVDGMHRKIPNIVQIKNWGENLVKAFFTFFTWLSKVLYPASLCK